ncbi:MAG: GNAT family N-acetyltransferase [Xanthomonadales bacterium]|nr:GNAT family N-acetyltransferase [Xanthomonadales bacterium]NIN58474.1 GNAT family N-acetyltransferase [Xanthomonadales bacterium]NIN76026.1 GNAT family N-acetyltransferase [Xanthomonadales bacterium]NIO13662.1 GNAT family N-acetyltransferase [Xanthomonadales bacterium]NIP10867.1 GNAT family N-acetyltransferase [Xanthomonadales bacterium]
MSEALELGYRTYLRAPRLEDTREFTRAMRESQGLHHPWVSAPSDPRAYRRYLDRLAQDTEAGFLVRRHADHAICGVVNLNVITYEALCSAYLSYYAVKRYSGRGYMREGLQQVVDIAFGELGLHRLEANIQPGNEASIRLVQSLGFECEGYSPRYLRINGKWRDHERWALLADS